MGGQRWRGRLQGPSLHLGPWMEIALPVPVGSSFPNLPLPPLMVTVTPDARPTQDGQAAGQPRPWLTSRSEVPAGGAGTPECNDDPQRHGEPLARRQACGHGVWACRRVTPRVSRCGESGTRGPTRGGCRLSRRTARVLQDVPVRSPPSP